jgi:ABC-type multidrug transport system ATPase subunit
LILHELKKVFIKKSNRLSLPKANLTRSGTVSSKQRDTEFVAVDSLTFGVPAGECFGLLGVNGAGKTTTFKMLTTDLKPTSGSIFVSDPSNPAAFIQGLINTKSYWSRIGYCPQFDALYDELTPADHIRLFARLKGVRTSMENKLVHALLKRLDLLQYEEKPCGSLSLGNKRKVSTALCLVGNPSIVLLDEPTSGMDPMSRRKLWQEIINLTR